MVEAELERVTKFKDDFPIETQLQMAARVVSEFGANHTSIRGTDGSK